MVILSDLLRRKTKLNTENFFCPAVDFQFNYIVTSVFIIVVNNIQLKVNQEVLTVFEFSKPPRIVCALSRLFLRWWGIWFLSYEAYNWNEWYETFVESISSPSWRIPSSWKRRRIISPKKLISVFFKIYSPSLSVSHSSRQSAEKVLKTKQEARKNRKSFDVMRRTAMKFAWEKFIVNLCELCLLENYCVKSQRNIFSENDSEDENLSWWIVWICCEMNQMNWRGSQTGVNVTSFPIKEIETWRGRKVCSTRENIW